MTVHKRDWKSPMAANLVSSGSRSPRYPRISLGSALDHAKSIYQGAHRSAISSDTAYKLMGFSGKTGSSAAALGAIRQFGLVDGLRGDLKISALALSIFEPESIFEYAAAVEKAAFNPDIFQEISAQFGGRIPPADEPIRAFLIRNHDFSSAGANDCIAALRETLLEVERFTEVRVVDRDEAAAENLVRTPEPSVQSQSTPAMDAEELISHDPGIPVRVAKLPLSKESEAEIRITGKITATGIDRLIAYLDVMKDAWLDE